MGDDAKDSKDSLAQREMRKKFMLAENYAAQYKTIGEVMHANLKPIKFKSLHGLDLKSSPWADELFPCAYDYEMKTLNAKQPQKETATMQDRIIVSYIVIQTQTGMDGSTGYIPSTLIDNGIILATSLDAAKYELARRENVKNVPADKLLISVRVYIATS